MNRETFDIALSAYQERSDERKGEWLREEARALLACHEITAQIYSDILMRLTRRDEVDERLPR